MSTYLDLHRLVVSGDLDARERTTESALAARLGTSRTPVREALQRLHSEGLVFAEGRGVRVRVLPLEELVELFTARAGLEGWAAFQAASRVQAGLVPPAQLAELDRLAEAADTLTSTGEIERGADANRAFHERIVALADNSPISATLSQWWDRTVVSTRHTIRTPQRVAAVDAEHTRILDALRRGDAAAARDAAQNHITSTRDALIALNEENPS